MPDDNDAVRRLGTVDHLLRGPSPDATWTPPSPDKIVHMDLTWIDAAKCYKIITVTNTAYYKPDQWIMEADLHKISAMPRWTFSVTVPDYIGMILGVAHKLMPPLL